MTVPQPDPTVLTTQQLQREIATSREIVETRLNANDKAIELLQRIADKLPAQVTKEIDTLKELHQEKFASIATQFTERDTRAEQTSKDSKVAVDAALQAAKEAVEKQNTSSSLAISKSETATAKQIDQMGQLMAATTQATNDKIDDLKSRLTAVESLRKGGAEGIGLIGSIVLGIVAVLGLIVSIAGFVFVVART